MAPFLVFLTLLYVGTAIAAFQINDPQINKLLQAKPTQVATLYFGSLFYFIFLFWLFDYGIHSIRKLLSRIFKVNIIDRNYISDLRSDRDISFTGWDVIGHPFLAVAVYVLEATIYAVTILGPITLAAFWAYSAFSK